MMYCSVLFQNVEYAVHRLCFMPNTDWVASLCLASGAVILGKQSRVNHIKRLLLQKQDLGSKILV